MPEAIEVEPVAAGRAAAVSGQRCRRERCDDGGACDDRASGHQHRQCGRRVDPVHRERDRPPGGAPPGQLAELADRDEEVACASTEDDASADGPTVPQPAPRHSARREEQRDADGDAQHGDLPADGGDHRMPGDDITADVQAAASP